MSSVLPVPEVRRPGGGTLTAGDGWRTVRAVGVRPLAVQSFLRFRYGDGFSHARALGLQLALTAIPLVIAVVGLSNELGATEVGRLLRATVLTLTPGASDGLLQAALPPLSETGDDTGAELALWLGLAAGLLSLTTAMGQLERGANRLHGVQRDRPSLHKYRRAGALALLAGLPVMTGFLVLVSASALGQGLERAYGVDDDTVSALAWPLGAVLMLAGVVLMLRVAPRRTPPAWSWLACSGVLALLAWLASSGLLAAYLSVSTRLGSVYGPLTGVLALLLWAQLSALAVFAALAVSAQLEATAGGQRHADAPDRPAGAPAPAASTRTVPAYRAAAGPVRPTPPAQGRPAGTDARCWLPRSGARALLGLLAVVAGAVPFLALLLLVLGWAPLQTLDDRVADALNAVVVQSPLLVRVLQVLTDAGGTGTAVYVLVLAAVCLTIRRQRRLAWYVTVAGLGLAVLVPVSKALVGRDRPAVDLPVVGLPANASFPSGHAMTSLVTWGVLLLIALPVVRARWRRPLVLATVGLVLLVGVTRLALGVHFVSDVLAGWALGLAWLAAVTAAFRGWQHDEHPVVDPPDGDPPAAVALRPARPGPAVLPGGRRGAVRLAAAWLAVFVGVSALGLGVTEVPAGSALARFDSWAVRALLEQRGPLDDLVRAVNALSGTRAVVAVGLALAVVALAVTASWRPVLFVALAVLGEVSLYATVAQVVGRPRPGVPDLTSDLPAGASFPSGHVAAAAALYGALAVLVIALGTGRHRRWVLLVPALLVPAIAVGRVYVAAHHPTDVLGGALLGGLWVLAVARLLQPSDARAVVPGTACTVRQSSATRPRPG